MYMKKWQMAVLIAAIYLAPIMPHNLFWAWVMCGLAVILAIKDK